MVSKRTQELIQTDREAIIPNMGIVGQNIGFIIEEAHGIYLVDTEGKKYIDFSSQVVCCNLGHRRQELIDAMIAAMNKIDYVTRFYGMSNVYVIELARKLSKITPGNLKHFFFVSGGSESTDSAMKIARLYWSNKGMTGKYKIISLYDSYHGSGGLSTYASGISGGVMRNSFGPEPIGFIRVPSYYSYRSMFGDLPDSGLMSARFLEQVIQAEGPASIAAFIAEPMLGAGGAIEPPPKWWPMVAKICKEYGILLIVDEVKSGFGRSGKMFASEYWNLKPDIMTMSKAITNAVMPLGAVAISDEVYAGLQGKMFPHGFTFGGHTLSCAVACAALDIYERDKVVENAAKVGNHIKQRLEAEFMPLPCVGDIDGHGVFQSMELVNDKRSKTPIDRDDIKTLEQKLLYNGIFTKIEGRLNNRMLFCPPCVITVEEADKAIDIIKPLVAELKPRKT